MTIPRNVTKAVLIEVKVTAFWLPPAERTYSVTVATMQRLLLNDNSRIFVKTDLYILFPSRELSINSIAEAKLMHRRLMLGLPNELKAKTRNRRHRSVSISPVQ